MRFTKMHGLGNDYVYMEGFRQPVPADPAALSRVIADRHRGVGGDGLILVLPSDRAHARMRMFNADGSEAEMCGNGIRCVAKLVWDHGLARANPLTIETGRGLLTLELFLDSASRVDRVRVDMGPPILAAASIPTTWPASRVIAHELPPDLIDLNEAWLKTARLEPKVTCVSMGNPHAILYCGDVAAVPLATVGPALETARMFPKRINVHFVQVLSRSEAVMRTWERGSGITQACGTGACAVGVASVLTGCMDQEVRLHLPGGDLEIAWPGEDRGVLMTGPATEVFSGEWPDELPK